ncbi:cytochrome c oxidase, cbb3-type, CcoQ subunit [Campylobacter sp. FMV-PI01]|uniref:Cytochrome c oxidase, cbb3-type, CcoQ subunit n=1 Tax=Campylobacter portucalensis TaxID=2608384 RepID=A0A6L5WGL3_9BACT|nr:cytochrome c oxidase, cbb3-type, CcoQ subunit [Campylobacter portucalensis]MSN96139.1 cytochrome c oxidase, cbb3-type, CcoQ subunit [Campylobacter portucalensis]
MSIETIRTIQAYGYFILIVFLCIGLYGYFFHLHKSEKTGRRNYEKYGNLAVNDDIDDEILESNSSSKQ